MPKIDCRYWRTGFLFLSVLFLGCGGLNRNIELQPLAPVLAGQGATVNKERGGSWWIDLGGAEFRISSVRLSSKVTWVFGPFVAFPTLGLEDEVLEEGPLRIVLHVKVKEQLSVSFDPSQFIIVLDDAASLSPIAITNRNKDAKSEAVKPVTLSDKENWLWLHYDVSVADLKPFTFRPGAIRVDGRTVKIPPVSFERGRSYSGS